MKVQLEQREATADPGAAILSLLTSFGSDYRDPTQMQVKRHCSSWPVKSLDPLRPGTNDYNALT